jgi:hypothetical protein
MRQSGETVEQADRKALDWLDRQRELAKEHQSASDYQGRNRLSLAALEHFGAGAHTIMDNTSPAHSPYQEYTIPPPSAGNYTGPDADMVALGYYILSIMCHSEEESRPPTPEEEAQAINDMRHYFGTIFGEEALKRAITQPPSPTSPRQDD